VADQHTTPTASVRDTGTDDGTLVRSIHARLAALRTELARSSADHPRVWSVDGATFQFDLVTDDPVPVGGYVVVHAADGSRLLGQVTALEPTDRPGPTVSIDLAESGVGLGVSTTAAVRLPIPAVVGSGPILGALDADGGLGPPPRRAFDAATLTVAPAAAVAAATALDDVGGLAFGTVLSGEDVPLVLAAKGFGRHTFVCGQSGSGKTYALGKLLEQLLLRTSLPIVVLDPNSDYVTLTEVRDREETGLDEEEYAELRDRILSLRDAVPVFGGAGDLGVAFGRLSVEQRAAVLGLDPVRDPELYGVLVRVDDQMDQTTTIEAFLDLLAADDVGRALADRARNLGVNRWGIWAGAADRLAADRLTEDWRVAIFDLGSIASAAERSAVSATVLGAMWERRYAREPVLVVIDEAHNVCPAEATSATQAVAADLVRAIAAEGRKFGLYLVLSTQEPHKVHPDVLSQCANLLLMRTTSREALQRLQSVFSDVPPGLLDLAPGFTIGQGVVAGRIAPHALTFRTGRRLTRDGGRDVPADWAGRQPS
jgi:DNA helicase HerA-like ATPase